MKTKSDSLFHVLSRRVLVTLLLRTRYLAAVSLMMIAVLLTCYSAAANARRGDMREASSEAGISPEEEDEGPEYIEERREFLDRFFAKGPGGVSPSAHANALAAARALPPSPLLQGRRFVLPEMPDTVAPWTSPLPPPIQNSYGGNASARVHALAIDPNNPDAVYTGSFGGLAKTTDGGITWWYLSDAWASQSVSSIAVNPAAPSHVYVGTGADPHFGVGLYRSLDRGTTWSNLGATQFGGTVIRRIAIGSRSRTGSIVYVANGLSHSSGLWRSSDSGVTWTRLRQAGHLPGQQMDPDKEFDGIHDLAIDPSTIPSALYITDDDGVFKSIDSGQSWTRMHAFLAEPKNRLYRLSLVNSTVYLLGPGDPDPDHNLYLYKSIDSGATWIQISTNCPGGADSCANANNIGFSVFAVDAFNTNIILAGNQALYRTDNEGAIWTEIGDKWGNDPDPTREIHTDQQVIAFSPTTLGVVYEGNDGGIVRSTDGGLHWANLNQNFSGALTYGVALSADGSMIAGTQDNGIVFSDPFATLGRAWDSIYGGDSAHNLIDPVNGAIGYFTMYRDNVFKRFNRATPHSSVNIRPDQFDADCKCNFFPTFSMNPLSPTHLIAACQTVVRTLNGPTVTRSGWTTIGNGPLPSPTASPCESRGVVTAATEAPSNSDVIYAVTNYDTVFVTTTAGQGNRAVWNQVTQKNHPGGISAVTVDPTNYQTAYLACDSGVYKTTDTGMTWTQQIPQQLQNLIYRDVAIDPANPQYIFAASSAGVFASTDGGGTWGNMSDGIPAGMVVSALSFNAISRQLAASTYGRGVYILNLGASPKVSISLSANLATTPGL